MTTLLLALTFATGTALGVFLGPTDQGAVLLALAAGLAVLAGCVRGVGRARVGLVVAVFGLCGLVRGGVGGPVGELEVVGTGLVRAAVVGASMPAGHRCEVMVRLQEPAEHWLLQVDPARCPLSDGQEVWIKSGDLSIAPGPRWPGEEVADPRRRGGDRRFVIDDVWPASAAPDGYWRAVAELRQAGDEAARGRADRGFVVAAVLGLPAALPPTEREALRGAGLGHLVAVSGMNVAVAAMLLRGPLLRLGLLLGGGLTLGCVLACVPVAGYVGLTGAAPPAMRAAVMFGLVSLAAVCGRAPHGPTLLALASAGLLAWRPAWALDAGFHLSVAAMAVLVRPVEPGEAPPGLLRQSWEVTWVTCPIGIVHFGEAAAWGVLSNLIAVPVFTVWVLPLGALGCALWPWFGPEALTPAAWGGRVILDLAAVVSWAPRVPAWGLAVAAGVCMGVRWIRPRWPLPGFWIGSATIAAVVFAGPRVVEEVPEKWVAVGGAREPAALVPLAGTERLACVRDPGLHPGAWAPLLAALGYRGVAGISASRGGGAAPHVVAVREELAASGLWRPQDGCVVPAMKPLKAAVSRCLSMTGQRMAAAREGECFVGGAWVAVKAS